MSEIFLDDDSADTDMLDFIKGDGIRDTGMPWTDYTVYVNLSQGLPSGRYAGLYVIEVYDGDLSGRNDTWTSEAYTELAEAETAYASRLAEIRENVPGYVANVFGPSHEAAD